MTRRRLGVYLAVALSLLGVVAGVAVGVTRDWTPDQEAFTVGQSRDPIVGLERYPPDTRAELPELRGPDLDGNQLSTSDFTGQILVINLWGSWCAPCRKEAPGFAAASKELAGQGVQFLGIDTRDSVGAAQAFMRRYGITYPSFDDRSSDVLLELAGIVPVSAVPSTVFVDAEGRVAARVIGPVDDTTLNGLLDDLLAEMQTASPSP